MHGVCMRDALLVSLGIMLYCLYRALSLQMIPVDSDGTTQSTGFINPTEAGIELGTMSEIPDAVTG